ncbi:phage tail sheath subtilisin-like domain-containing protein [Echinicola jeungdonensis]|uniref:Phage tail sheath C-terminal domain-containing protein n=1 Tax=Echinicola jeungdonensis TaxID=709343 RepID=A0ABV5J7A1_9BACT|nr:phage tail sheath C-terminal domain-containing protein [Echinicola jeungdonensis]MDN3670824.1 phage tail sheath subtilisin-like domain-containing protein [Echinicola jeungdonensis]
MATTIKTPGVYIEEISKFPPSVAQVETAIPAFIGYTEKAKDGDKDLPANEPVKISSVLEFTEHFGGPPQVDVTTLEINAQNQVSDLALAEKFYLYECIRMFYANGGGDCYIVSVGKYTDTVQNGTADGSTPGFLAGLAKIKKVDRPTLLVVPDASLMSQSNVNSLYAAMLGQCNELKDRFCIFDLKESGADYEDAVEDFRNGIGMNYLKYSAAYSPWLKANLPRVVKYKDIKGKITQNGPVVDLADLIADPDAKDLANRLDNLVDDQTTINGALDTLKGSHSSYQARFEALANTLKNTPNKANLEALINFYTESMDLVRDTIDLGGSAITLKDKSTPAGNLKFLFDFLVSKLGTALDNTENEIAKISSDSSALSSALTLTASTTGLDYTTTTSTNVYFGSGTTNQEKIQPHVGAFNKLWNSIKSSLDLISTSAESYTATVETSTVEAIPALKTIFQRIANEYLTLPPSATIAGVYARVDSNRGVWKAPANVSLNNVIGVTELIDNKEQENLNVDVVAGKSINIIRPFTGKGIMVWGARTLAGNDNEWRYVPIRRFFNMAEESIKKATEQFVFEPNDGNTWVRVRAMIENFLTLQWRAGALAGAKPEHAFYVKVGLGQTMTSQDILEGKMNVEIGMAVVRPAEFIVLKFSHKMQES